MPGANLNVEPSETEDFLPFVAEYFANRQRDPRDKITKVSNLRSDLERQGRKLSHEDVVQIFEKLQSLGAGEFKRGKPRVKKDRFEWKVSARSFAKELANSGGDERLPVAQSTEESKSTLDHRYRLRADFEVVLRLPIDITRSEATRLAEFIKTLPFENE